MPVPRNVDEEFEIVRSGEVEKPFGGDVIDADEVCAKFADLGEVSGGLFG